jgi:hypothetical protein
MHDIPGTYMSIADTLWQQQASDSGSTGTWDSRIYAVGDRPDHTSTGVTPALSSSFDSSGAVVPERPSLSREEAAPPSLDTQAAVYAVPQGVAPAGSPAAAVVVYDSVAMTLQGGHVPWDEKTYVSGDEVSGWDSRLYATTA